MTLYKANSSNELILKSAKEGGLFWVRLMRIKGNGPDKPTTNESYIKAFRPKEWESFQRYDREHEGKQWHVTFLQSPICEILHDPRINNGIEITKR